METCISHLENGDWFLWAGDNTTSLEVIACKVWQPRYSYQNRLCYVLDELENDMSYPNKFPLNVHKEACRFIGEFHIIKSTQKELHIEYESSQKSMVTVSDGKGDSYE